MEGQTELFPEDRSHYCWAPEFDEEWRSGRCHRCLLVTRQRALIAACREVHVAVREIGRAYNSDGSPALRDR